MMVIFATGLSLAAVAAFALLLVAAAIGDARHYVISNRLCLAVAGTSVLFLASQMLAPVDARITPLSLPFIIKTALIALTVFAICLALFARGVMGGGDVKLITVCMLWAGPGLALPFLFYTALAGGLVTLVVMVRARFPDLVPAFSPIVNPLDPNMEQTKVPYGIAIAIGGLYVAGSLVSRTSLGA